MSKVIKCDNVGCDRTAKGLDPYGSSPKDWITVTRSQTEDRHFCSPQCAGTFFRREVEARVHGEPLVQVG